MTWENNTWIKERRDFISLKFVVAIHCVCFISLFFFLFLFCFTIHLSSCTHAHYIMLLTSWAIPGMYGSYHLATKGLCMLPFAFRLPFYFGRFDFLWLTIIHDQLYMTSDLSCSWQRFSIHERFHKLWKLLKTVLSSHIKTHHLLCCPYQFKLFPSLTEPSASSLLEFLLHL